MINLRLVLADQLTHSITSLSGIDRKNDVVIMSELIREFTYVKHHKKKIAFILSAMRHFAKELRDTKIKVDYTSLLDFGQIASIFRRKICPNKRNLH